MAAKATLRNQKPLVIGVSTNDGLGLNSKNIMHLLNQKEYILSLLVKMIMKISLIL